VSASVQAFLSGQLGVPPESIRVIANGVALGVPTSDGVAAVSARLTQAAGSRLGAIASLTEKKGHEVLLRAVARLRQNRVGCSLVIAGEGPDRERLEALSRKLGLAAHVHFLGHVSNPADVVAAVDLFVLPSLVEGLPLALLEAMYAGKPCIATSVGGVPEVIRSGENGLLVPAGNEIALADAIAALAGSSELRRRLAAAARTTIERSFTERAYLESLEALYVELTDRRAPPPPRTH
jgi:glycosyltransferase involved in cell wall biosynthesis